MNNRGKSGSATAGAILILCGTMWLWVELVEDHVVPKRWAAVEKGSIYRSGQLSPSLVKKTLKRHKIAAIVDLTGDDPQDEAQQAEKKAAAELDIRLTRFPLKGDGTGDIASYAGAIAEIVRARRQGERVLVHCHAGVMRTGGVVACYRLLVERRTPHFVIGELRENRWDPKDGRILLDYVNEHLGELATTLRAARVIDEIPSPLPILNVRP
jgi:protein tyrosine/serine phosphatase